MICHAQKCLINHALLSNSAQKFEDMERKKHTSNLIQFFYFFQSSFFWLGHTIPIILYSTNIFCKKTSLFFIIFNTIYFFNNSYLFQTCQIFSILIQHSKIFFRRKRIRHLFFRFFILFKIKRYPIARKKWNVKLFFVVFFSEIQKTFSVLTKVKFF